MSTIKSSRQGDKAVKQRLYVGGLGPSVTAAELGQRFESFGTVEAVQIINKQGCQSGEEEFFKKRDRFGRNPTLYLLLECRGFAFVNMVISDTMLTRCAGIYNKSKWKGMQLKIQVAKTSFMER